MKTIEQIADGLQSSRLGVRGIVNLAPDEKCPISVSGQPARTIVLIGHAGGMFWPVFQREADFGSRHPLDQWSRSVINGVACKIGAHAIYPNDKPYWPFQAWAKRAMGLKASPLGLLMDAECGLWHAFRGAIALSEVIEPDGDTDGSRAHPCQNCAQKPCLNICPVNAISPDGYDVAICKAHIISETGKKCLGGGCLARHACPVGQEYTYSGNQLAFHMKAFVNG